MHRYSDRYGSPPDLDDPIAASALAELGWDAVMGSSNLTATAKAFAKIYHRHRHRPPGDAPNLPGVA